jgi:hypothetical protein
MTCLQVNRNSVASPEREILFLSSENEKLMEEIKRIQARLNEMEGSTPIRQPPKRFDKQQGALLL